MKFGVISSKLKSRLCFVDQRPTVHIERHQVCLMCWEPSAPISLNKARSVKSHRICYGIHWCELGYPLPRFPIWNSHKKFSVKNTKTTFVALLVYKMNSHYQNNHATTNIKVDHYHDFNVSIILQNVVLKVCPTSILQTVWKLKEKKNT